MPKADIEFHGTTMMTMGARFAPWALFFVAIPATAQGEEQVAVLPLQAKRVPEGIAPILDDIRVRGDPPQAALRPPPAL